MLKITIVFLVILLLINPFFVEFSKSFFICEKSIRINDFVFSPDEIKLKDDAFHDAKTSYYTEWWYFDAAFDNNYSAQMSVRIAKMLNLGFVFKRLDIYKDGVILSHNQKLYLIQDFSTSKEKPLVYLDDFCVINGYIDNFTGNWVYDLSFQFDDASALLKFIGCTKGWKGQLHGNDWWGVSLPRAKTSGTLIINDKLINVTGIGYHDHNWEVTASTVINFGWYWGKIHTANYTITWAKIMRTKITGYPILVINKNHGEYLNIEPTQIQFIADNFSFENRHLIPHSFKLIADKKNISINVKMEVINIHHDRFFIFMNYWRYHINCQGFITVNSQTETIDTIQVAEFIRFR